MWICTNAFHVPKRGNAETEYEDAYFPRARCARELSEFRCAVADGASESAFSGLWAQLLVRSFGRGRMRLGRLRKLWRRATGSTTGGQNLPWYLEKKIAHGAHAAFVGLALRDGSSNGTPETLRTKKKTKKAIPSNGGSWRALAVGDSCVFQVRGDELLAVGPLDKSDQFNNSPYLISSKGKEKIRSGDDHVDVMDGDWRSGDIFCLATDALSQWLLAEHEAGRPPWSILRVVGRGDKAPGFDQIVEALRTMGALHNDDTTLLRVETL